jgi:hypothetical protein
MKCPRCSSSRTPLSKSGNPGIYGANAFEFESGVEPHRPPHHHVHAADRGARHHLEFARALTSSACSKAATTSRFWPRIPGCLQAAGLWQSGHCVAEIDAASCNWGQLVFLRARLDVVSRLLGWGADCDDRG